jgi:hypothetical protein
MYISAKYLVEAGRERFQGRAVISSFRTDPRRSVFPFRRVELEST